MNIRDDLRDEQEGRLIDFDQAVVITPMIEPPQPRLVVNGVKPHPDMEISLRPLVYVSQPQYQGIQVVGAPAFYGDHVMPAIAPIPFSVELDLIGITGTEGVEVIGATVTEQLAVASPVPATEA